MNITDIDDKTIKKSIAENKSLKEITGYYEEAFKKDIETLGVLPAEKYPRATEHVPEMIEMIKALGKKEHTYEAQGSVYFRINSFKEYGKLSHLAQEDLKDYASERIDSDEYEKNR